MELLHPLSILSEPTPTLPLLVHRNVNVIIPNTGHIVRPLWKFIPKILQGIQDQDISIKVNDLGNTLGQDFIQNKTDQATYIPPPS